MKTGKSVSQERMGAQTDRHTDNIKDKPSSEDFHDPSNPTHNAICESVRRQSRSFDVNCRVQGLQLIYIQFIDSLETHALLRRA